MHAGCAMQDFADCQIDLISAHKLLQIAAKDIPQLRRSFDAVLNEAFTIASTWGMPSVVSLHEYTGLLKKQ